MGVYDIFPGGQQVKCWKCDLRHVKVGDDVDPIDKVCTYFIALREGGFAHISDCKYIGVTDTLIPGFPVFDKWGGLFDGSKKGPLDENYLFK